MYDKEINQEKLAIDTGYLYFIDYSHPLATGNSGRVYLHRHVASIKEGRWLTREEQVHHIDGNKLNNTPDNLAVLSCSDHSRLHKPLTEELICPTCTITFRQRSTDQKFCSVSCARSHYIKNKHITKEILEELIPLYSWVELGKLFGYSDNGIKKRAKILGCKIPSRKGIKRN